MIRQTTNTITNRRLNNVDAKIIKHTQQTEAWTTQSRKYSTLRMSFCSMRSVKRMLFHRRPDKHKWISVDDATNQHQFNTLCTQSPGSLPTYADIVRAVLLGISWIFVDLLHHRLKFIFVCTAVERSVKTNKNAWRLTNVVSRWPINYTYAAATKMNWNLISSIRKLHNLRCRFHTVYSWEHIFLSLIRVPLNTVSIFSENIHLCKNGKYIFSYWKVSLKSRFHYLQV